MSSYISQSVSLKKRNAARDGKRNSQTSYFRHFIFVEMYEYHLYYKLKVQISKYIIQIPRHYCKDVDTEDRIKLFNLSDITI